MTITLWQWRYRYGSPWARWKVYREDGKTPDCWWMQMEYREVPRPGIVWG